MLKKLIKSIDYIIIGVCLALFAIGIVALYSANGGADGDTSETMKQLIWLRRGNFNNVSALFL